MRKNLSNAFVEKELLDAGCWLIGDRNLHFGCGGYRIQSASVGNAFVIVALPCDRAWLALDVPLFKQESASFLCSNGMNGITEKCSAMTKSLSVLGNPT